MNDINIHWRKGKATTLQFYSRKVLYKEKQFNHIFPLDPYFNDMIGDKKEVYIADIGAGMFSTTGSTKEGVVVHLYPSDILSENFKKILDQNNIIPVIPVMKEDMTQLSYPDHFFDIVHCANALDHCHDPWTAIKEMYRVCKPGGYIYLKHFQNVAEYQGYGGFHQWNLDIVECDDCLIWNKENSFYLSSIYKDFVTHTEHNKNMRPNTSIISILCKQS